MFRFADCELDPMRFELRRAGQRVHVEPQVFQVLQYLVDNCDRVVSKSELLDGVWGSRFVGESALASRIKAARQAVGDDGRRQRVIATVHGVGYRLIAHVEPSASGSRKISPARSAQEIRFCHSPAGVRIAYATSGQGSALVKAANWFSHLDHDWNSPLWARWIDELSARHRLVRYDERGCGMSDWDVGDFGYDTWVEDLELVVDAAGLGAFDLLGLSQGGAVAVGFAARHPELVRRLVLVGGYCRGRAVRAQTEPDQEEAALDLALGRLTWHREDSAYRQFLASQFLPDAPRELWEAFNAAQRATTSTGNAVQFLKTIAEIDVSGLAPQVECPTLILHSSGDQRVPKSQAHELAQLISDSRLRLLDSHNHIITDTEPAWSMLMTEIEAFIHS